ncbi:hypothetical protein FACS189485_19970 [Spirochaetia bacterium]|nr:hypothetical protein FACS189485_19970 [Spirochaetia bacterium]
MESVNVLYDEADWSYTLRILISFVDGNWILVDEITHTSEHIKVQACNGYYLFNYLKPNNEDSVYVLGFKYNFNAENILINNVIDIVKNYKIICEEYEKYDIVYNEKILAENYYYRQYTDHYLNEHESGEYTTFTVRRPLDDIFLKDWRKKY